MIPNKITNEYKFIHYEGEKIAGIYESSKLKNPVEVYFPYSLIVYMEYGTSTVQFRGSKLRFPAQSFYLIRKYTKCILSKSYGESEDKVKFFVFALNTDIVRSFAKRFNFPETIQPIGDRILKLEDAPRMREIMRKIEQRANDGEDYNASQIQQITYEALNAIFSEDLSLSAIFKSYVLAHRIDLEDFMEYHFLQNKNIDELAKMAGRSVSTFNREFRMIFNETPHRWIMAKRLDVAKKMLEETDIAIGEVCLESGFKDLTHFGKCFKKKYGIQPSKIRSRGFS